MKNTSILFIALICCMIAACSEPAATSREETSKPAITMKDMAGTWQSADLRIEITSKDGGPENDTLVVKADEYAEKLQIKSHMAEYREAGTYTESYINRQDSVFQQPAGRWEIKGDSFVVYQEKPKASRRAYHISIEGEDATFTGYVDWDGDGAKDDFFVGKSVKVIDEKDIH